MKLTLEQQFAIKAFKVKAKNLSREEAQKQLIELYIKLIVLENYYTPLVKKEWGL